MENIKEIEIVKIMNETMIRFLKSKGKKTEINERIKKNLEDEAFFFKIDKVNAYKILENVGIRNEEIAKTYKELISAKEFYELIHKGKINSTDNLKIKYDTDNYKNIFKK